MGKARRACVASSSWTRGAAAPSWLRAHSPLSPVFSWLSETAKGYEYVKRQGS